MFYIHILTDSRRIENTISNKYEVLCPMEKQTCQTEGLKVEGRAYKLDCGQIELEVDCLEIRDQEDMGKAGYLIIPEFLIPGRPYPIYIYLYAVATYCYNPRMGQREAAKRTRERFGLETFSHTTLSRALKKLERLMKKNKNEPESKTEPVEAPNAQKAGKLPTVDQMKNRKYRMASYLKKAAADDSSLKHEAGQLRKHPDYKRPPYTGAFIGACHSIVKYTFLKYHCLLL